MLSRISIAAPIILLLSFLIAIGFSLIKWRNRYQQPREYFAIAAFLSLILATLTTLSFFSVGFMPWHVADASIALLYDQQMELTSPRWSEYFLLILLYLLVVRYLTQLHRSWDGLKSLEQIRQEQSGYSPPLITQGSREVIRILKGGTPPIPHYEVDNRQLVSQLEPATDSLAWKDQARELIKFSSSSYLFSLDTGWHDRERCWIGKNVHTDDPVFLLPSQEAVTDAERNAFVSYAHRIATEQGKSQYELIIAVKDGPINQPVLYQGRAIRYETESSLLDNLVDFSDYKDKIRRRVLKDTLPDSAFTIRDVYVPSRYSRLNLAEPTDDIEEHLHHWLEELSQRQLALLGDYGQGKSTATLMFTYHLLFNERNSKRTPILIELRGTSPRNLTPLQLLGAWASQYDINPKALLRLHIAGRLLLIFEGFDEMALVGDLEMRLKHFRTLWQFCYPQAKILITGRPNFFLDEEEMKAALGINKPMGDRPYCEAIRLVPFTLDQIGESLRAYKEVVREQICSLAESNSRFLELVSRPSLLYIVSVLWEKERLSEKADRLNSAFIMDLFIRHSYRRQGLKQAETPEFMALTTLEREYFMSGIAAFMAANSLPNQINASQLNKAIDNLIDDIPDSISKDSPAILGETDKPLRFRVQGTEFGVEHVKTDVRACGLLIDDPAAPGTFRFGHKSFMEYLFASVLAEHILEDESAKARAIMRSTNARIEHILSLPVSVDFLSELLSSYEKNDQKNNGKRTSEYQRTQKSIATRLLKTIFSERMFPAIFFRHFMMFEIAYRNSLPNSSLSFFLRLITPFTTTLTILMLSIMSFQYTYLQRYKELKLQEISNVASNDVQSTVPQVFVYSTLMLSTMIIVMLLFLSLRGTRNEVFRRKIGLWNYICKQLGIEDQVLHRVIGTSKLPWTKGRPFNYFMNYFEGKH